MATNLSIPDVADGIAETLRALPDDFVIGTASSAFQVEGALDAHGRQPSIWDTFLGADGRTAATACDHLAHLEEDLDALAGVGVDAYRFSISWTRALTPTGAVNEAGMDVYRRLVDGLRARDIAPIACLYHWDLPQALQDQGGWESRETALRLGEFAALAAARLRDGVAGWVTINEPYIHLLQGHLRGEHAPGLQLMDWSRQAHHLLLGHGCALAALRAEGAEGVGMIENLAPIRPVRAGERHQRAAVMLDVLTNRLTVDPVLTGAYPEMFAPMIAPVVRDGDLELISAPIDFLGVNYYGPQGVVALAPGTIPGFGPGDLTGLRRTSGGHWIDPDGLAETLTTLAERYADGLPPLLITEFGFDSDGESAAAAIDDHDRIAFLTEHLAAVSRAIDRGVDVRGAFVWSFLDSFEWSSELGTRYGLVHVDFANGTRTPKRSYRWLAGGLAARGRGPGARLGFPRRV
jgi:beta-glucosidase